MREDIVKIIVALLTAWGFKEIEVEQAVTEIGKAHGGAYITALTYDSSRVWVDHELYRCRIWKYIYISVWDGKIDDVYGDYLVNERPLYFRDGNNMHDFVEIGEYIANS